MDEKPSYGKAIGGAFVVGGVIGAVGHTIMLCYTFTPLYAAGFSTIMTLATLGVIGAILYVVGIYPKLEAFGGMGAALPFSGLASAVAGITHDVGKETGSVAKGAKTAIIGLLFKVVLLATAVCCVIAAIIMVTGFGAVYTAPYAPGGVMVELVGPPHGTAEGPPNGVPIGVDAMSFVWAILVAGAVCALAQLVLMLTKLSVPVFFVILIILSSLLTPFGVMQAAVELSGGGFQILIVGAGEAITSTFAALLSGNVVPFLSVLGLFVFLFALGIIAGAIRLSMERGIDDPAEVVPAE